MNNLTFVLHNIITLFVMLLNQKLKFAICKSVAPTLLHFYHIKPTCPIIFPRKNAGWISPTDTSIVILIQLIPHIHIILQTARTHCNTHITCRLFPCKSGKNPYILQFLKHNLYFCLIAVNYQFLTIHIRHNNSVLLSS